MGYRLGVDIGTTYTAAAVCRDGVSEMLGLGNRAMQIPSVLYLRPEGGFLVGEAAEARAAAEPERVAREFKRRIGDPVPILIAGTPFSAEALTARLLSWVVGVATERQGAPPDAITVSHPANWGAYKTDLLRQAFRLADLTDVATCTEPEAAAITYATRQRVGPGESVAVYDLGGGTFDAAVLRNDQGRFALVGSPEGIEHLGGVDFDEAVFQHVLQSLGPDARNLDPNDPQVVWALQRLRRDCVVAKETLSVDTEAMLPVVIGTVHSTVRLTRGEFEDMLRPALQETVATMRRVLRSADLEPNDVSAFVLVGGSSRIPLVSEVLVGAFGRPVGIDTHPKHDIALGAARSDEHAALPIPVPTPTPVPADGGPTAPGLPPGGPIPPEARGAQPSRRVSPQQAWTAAAVVVLAAVLIGLFVWPGLGSNSSNGAGSNAVTTSPPRSTGAVSSPPPTTTRPLGQPPLPKTELVWSQSVGNGSSLWTITTSGTGNKQPLIANVPQDSNNTAPALSHDRATIAYVHTDPAHPSPSIRLIGSDGKHDQPLFKTAQPTCPAAGRPAFSPDDATLAVPCGSGGAVRIYIVTVAGVIVGQPRASGDIGDPTFNSAGTKIGFWESTDKEKHTSLAEASVAGPLSHTVLTHGPNDNDPTFSPKPNDDSIAYRHGRDVDAEIFLLKPGSPTPERLTNDKQTEQDPSWSPDGTQIACKFGPSNAGDIAILDVRTKKLRPLVTSKEPDTTPAWTAR